MVPNMKALNTRTIHERTELIVIPYGHSGIALPSYLRSTPTMQKRATRPPMQEAISKAQWSFIHLNSAMYFDVGGVGFSCWNGCPMLVVNWVFLSRSRSWLSSVKLRCEFNSRSILVSLPWPWPSGQFPWMVMGESAFRGTNGTKC